MSMYESVNENIRGNDWINARKFGFVGDGVTPNDDVFARYIDGYDDTPIYFGPGVYAFEKTVNFPHSMFVEMDPKAELRCIAKEPLEYFVTLRLGDEDWGEFEDYALQSYIRGGLINANFCAKVGLGVHGALHTRFTGFMIRNVLEKGIVTQTSNLHDGCAYFENVYLYNAKGIPGTVAFYDNTADNIFMMCTAVNFETGIRTGGGKFTHVSCWFNRFGKNLIPTSVYAKVIGGSQSVFTNPMVDTYRTGFKLEKSATGGTPTTSIHDLVWITNRSFYTDGHRHPDDNLMRDYPMQVFHVENENCRLMVNGLYIPWLDGDFSFSNIPLKKSSFMQVRYDFGWDPWNHMENFRDDTTRMTEGKDLYDWSDMPEHDAWHAANPL